MSEFDRADRDDWTDWVSRTQSVLDAKTLVRRDVEFGPPATQTRIQPIAKPVYHENQLIISVSKYYRAPFVVQVSVGKVSLDESGVPILLLNIAVINRRCCDNYGRVCGDTYRVPLNLHNSTRQSAQVIAAHPYIMRALSKKYTYKMRERLSQ